MQYPIRLRFMNRAACAPARRCFGLLLALAAGHALRAAVPSPAVRPFVATNVSEFWNAPAEQKQLPQPIRLDLLVYYYDPEWKLLWGEAADGCSWFDNSGAPLPIRSGQSVRLEGAYVPAAGISGDTIKVTVLGAKPMPAPLPIAGALEQWQQFEAHWVTAQGYVCHQQEDGPAHVTYDMLCEGRLIQVHLLLGKTEPVPQLENALVRVNFVYASHRDPAGRLQSIEGWTPRRAEVTVVGQLASDGRFRQPAVAIEELGSRPAGTSVRVTGELHARNPGQSITVRDKSGQVVIRTEQPLTAQLGDAVEVVGRVSGQGISATLRDPVCRVIAAGAASDLAVASAVIDDEPVLKLRLADQVTGLRSDQAARHFPTSLYGVVTWSDPDADFFYLQDSSGGIRVQIRRPMAVPPTGAMLTLRGESTEGAFASEVKLTHLDVGSTTDLPPAQEVTFDQALSGAMEAQRVQMRGYVRAMETVGPWARLDLTTAMGEFSAYVRPTAAIREMIGAMVRVTGVCAAQTNAQRQLTGIVVWVAGADAVQVEEPRPADPFLAPEYPIDTLRQFVGVRMLDRQIRVSGLVLYNRPGRFAYLQNGNAAVMVLHRDVEPLRAGEWIEAVGLPGRDGNRLVLREAVWRRTRAGRNPTPATVARPDEPAEELDGRLVTVRGRLLDKMADEGGCWLMIRAGQTRFEAQVDHAAVDELPRDGSVVELTGIYTLQFDEYRRPHAFALQLRSADDLRVIQAASWWTTKRALAIAGGLGTCLLLGVGWLLALQRRVRRQTEQIRTQLENEARLSTELERATRLESLGVLAGGIAHDFNNLLTVVLANLGLAAMDDRVQEAAGPMIADAERGARRAAELTQQLLTFAKGGDPVRRSVALPDVVSEAAEFARHGSHVRCKIIADPGLPPADVDRAQISRVVHNLVLNATQAMPEGGVITLRLTMVEVVAGERCALAPGRYIRMTVSDNGPGIAPEHLARIFEPYFSTKPKNNGLGLATVHSIIRKHGGHIEVRSELGHGTTFEVWLPVAKEPPVAASSSPAARCGTVPLRVLFMDDEEVIRRAAAGVLRNLGHEATLVSDGSEVVREYETALRAGRRYDVVILDLTVPGGIGGRAAMETLRRIDPTVRAIVSSGYSQDPVLSNFRDYGFHAVVPKPYEIADLARAIQDVVKREREPVASA